jgi:signal peptidase
MIQLRRTPLHRSLRLAAGVATFGLLLGWWLLLRPTTLGGSASYVVVSGTSMEPVLRSGDLVVVSRSDRYSTGEIVAFHADGGLVVHRIVGGNASSGFTVRGDNRATADLWRPRSDEIIGVVRLHVPLGGRVVETVRSAPALGLLAGAGAFVLVQGGLPGGWRRRMRW